MEKKINIAKLLEDCPKGMELDCTMYDNCTLGSVLEGLAYPIRIDTPDGLVLLNEYGCYSRNEHAKCIIFPKGKTTWEGFVPPGGFEDGFEDVFEDGDIVATNSGQWIGITTGGVKLKCIPTYCVVKYNGKFEAYLEEKGTWGFNRLATEEEKQKLFKVINDNGYKWNAETKTLEKVDLKFHKGDWIMIDKPCQIISINNGNYIVQYCDDEKTHELSKNFCESHFHRWTIQDAKNGDVIFYDDGWTCIFKGVHGMWYSSYCFITYDGEFHTGYERHAVDSTITGYAHPATKEQCNFLFQKIKEAGYKWNAETKTLEKLVEPKFKVGDKVRHKNNHNVVFTITSIDIVEDSYGCGIATAFWFDNQDDYELVPNKFDITTLKPFDRVLARCSYLEKWRIQFFEKYDETCKYPFICMGYNKHGQCIPYEGNEHLLDTADNCDDFYKNWK